MRKGLRTVEVIMLMASVIVAGCTSTTLISSSQDDSVALLNERARSSGGIIRFQNGEKLKARGLRVDGDSLSFMTLSLPSNASAEDQVMSVPRGAVANIRFLSRGKGALEGLGLGVGIGFVSGFAMGALAAHEDCEGFLDFNCGSPTEVGFGYAVLNGILGAIIGPVAGVILGKKRNFVFERSAKP